MRASNRMQSRSIVPQFKAMSCCSYLYQKMIVKGVCVDKGAVHAFSPSAKCEEYFRLGADVLYGGGAAADLAPDHVAEDLDGVLLALKVDPGIKR